MAISNNSQSSRHLRKFNHELKLNQQIPYKKMIASASLPSHQRILTGQTSSVTPGDNQLSTDAEPSSMSLRSLDSSNSFLPPINPSGSLKKKKTNNFISNAVAALVIGNKKNSGNFFSQSQPSTAPNSRTSSPLRRQYSNSDNKNGQSGKSKMAIDKSLASKSSSIQTLAEKRGRRSLSPAYKITPSTPVKVHPTKPNTDMCSKTKQSNRRMSLPLNSHRNNTPPNHPVHKSAIREDPDERLSNIGCLTSHRAQENCKNISDPKPPLFTPPHESFIRSQRILSRFKSASQDPITNNSSHNKNDNTNIVLSDRSNRKENIYEEISLGSETKYETPITMILSTYQSPPMSSSSSSFSFLPTGYGFEEKTRFNQKCSDDGYFSQECQNSPHNNCMDAEHGFRAPNVTLSTIPIGFAKVNGKRGVAKRASIAEENKIKSENHSLLLGQTPLESPVQLKYILENGNSAELNVSKDFKNNALDEHCQPQRHDNFRISSGCNLLSSRKCHGQSRIRDNQTLTACCSEATDDRVCNDDNKELRRLRILIWSERKSNEQREMETERKWVEKMEKVITDTRIIEQSLKSQLQILWKQFVQLQDQLQNSAKSNRNEPLRIEAATQTERCEEIFNFGNFVGQTDRRKNHYEVTKSFDGGHSCSSCFDFARNNSTSALFSSITWPENESTIKQLKAELKDCKKVTEDERVIWMNERNNLLEYQQKLQLSWIQAVKKSALLAQQLRGTTRELDNSPQASNKH